MRGPTIKFFTLNAAALMLPPVEEWSFSNSLFFAHWDFLVFGLKVVFVEGL